MAKLLNQTLKWHEVLENIIISEEDVIEAINMVKPNKASGSDLISPRLFKEGANQLVLPLRKLFNLSLILGVEKIQRNCYS